MRIDFLDWVWLTFLTSFSWTEDGLMRLARWLVWRAERKRCCPRVGMNGPERGEEGESLKRATESGLLVRGQWMVSLGSLSL